MLRRILLWIAVSGIVALAAVIAVPFVLPADTVKKEVISLIERNTGWRIAIDGDIAMSVFPNIAMEAEQITVSPPRSAPLIKADEARFALSATKLLTGVIAIDEIRFEKPLVALALNDKGEPAFIARLKLKRPRPSTSNQELEKSNDEGLIASLVNTLSVQTLSIRDARIEVSQNGKDTQVYDNLTLEASLKEAQGPLELSGSARVGGETLALTGKIPAFKQFLTENSGNISVDIDVKGAKLATKGKLDLEGDDLFAGDVNFNIQDIQTTTGSNAIASGSAKAKGTLNATKSAATLQIKDGRILDTLFFSNLSVETGGERPKINGSIDLGAIDVQKLFPNKSDQAANTAQKPTTESAAIGIDLSPLQAVDTDITITSGSISSGEYKVEDLVAKLILNDGAANLVIDEIVAVGGSASGSLYADTKNSPLTTFGSIKADRLSLKTLLALAGLQDQVAKFDGLIGTDLKFGFQGIAPSSILSTANAQGTVSLFDTTIKDLGLATAFNDPRADTVSDLNIEVRISDVSQPITLTGGGNWRGEAISINADADPKALLDGKDAKTNAEIEFSKARLGFNGKVKTSLPVSGKISARGNSLRDLAKWIGTELPSGNGYGKFSFDTELTASETSVSLKNLNAELDDIKGSGTATVGLGSKPDVTATINFDLLDVNPYLATSEGDGHSSSSTTTQTASSSWSDEPIDFSALNAANIDLTANVKTLKAEGMSVGPLTLKAKILNGKLDANLADMRLYQGTGNATIAVNATGASPAIDLSLNSTNIDALPFLKDAAKFERIEGALALNLVMKATGNSQKALVASLNGTSKFAFTDGALRGINVARSMRALTSGALSGWNNVESEKTDFSAFNASFDIKDGIASNSDLNLVGPLVRVSGMGSANMPAKNLKYRVNPKVVASLEGQGGSNDLSGFAVPIIIDGPWDKPRIYPDISGFLENPAAGLEKLKSLGGGFAKIAGSKPAELITKITGGENGLTGTAGEAIGGLLKDGKITKEGGVAAAIGALGSALGKNKSSEADAAAPLKLGDLPTPRAKPKAPAGTNVGNAVRSLIENKVTGGNAEQTDGQAQPEAPADQAKKLIKGIGGLLNRN